ncbi:glycoside hydrolase family 2 TIM barrel-domain containing protein, partial [Neobacillus drentensis]|uniref:glycoside hydrolase family 2 TIM barrel-domain containing protein n=1 Tax=Neobacillus drentensis TaxID=220684 RepID=UPI003001D327
MTAGCRGWRTRYSARDISLYAKAVYSPRRGYANRPIILSEYSHCLENSLGNFQEYLDVINRYDNITGAFIWDFCDQSIRQYVNGQERFLYGGDFGEGDSNTYFCANGI